MIDTRTIATKKELELLRRFYGKDNHELTNCEVLKMLKSHCIDSREENGKVYAVELYADHSELIELTGIRRLNMLAYLGY